MPDVFRREPRNVGVLVVKGGEVAAKFIGETNPGEVDLRLARQFGNAKLYRLWVRYWRKSIESDHWIEGLLKDERITFSFVEGGSVSDVGDDSPEQICSYLFSMLVSSGGLAEASGVEKDIPLLKAKESLRREFRELRIMRSVARDHIRKPVYENFDVKGGKTWHQVSFCQSGENEKWIYEPIDLTTRRRKSARERAGYMNYVFSDLRNSENAVNTTAVVSVRKEDRKKKDVEYCLSALQDSSNQVVDWLDPESRREFLFECEQVALRP